MMKISSTSWSLLMMIYCQTSNKVSADPQVKMYQIGAGPRSVNANVTVISEVSDSNAAASVDITLHVTNSTDPTTLGTQVLYFSYSSWGNSPAYQETTPYPHLELSVDALKDLTRNFSWKFSQLPKSYNGLVLQTAVNGIIVYHTLEVLECPMNVSFATAVNPSNDPCGYGCTSQFNCSNDAPLADGDKTYECTAYAEWNETLPSCNKESTTSQKPTTSQASATSEDLPNTPPGQGGTATRDNTAPITITSIGVVFILIGVALIVIGWKNNYYGDKLKIVIASGGCCLAVWLIGVGLLFGQIDAFIAGVVIGAVSLLGMAGVIGIQVWSIATETKGIRGKKSGPDL